MATKQTPIVFNNTPELSRRLGAAMNWTDGWNLSEKYEFAVRTSAATNFEDLSADDQAVVLDCEKRRDAWIAANPQKVRDAVK